MEDGPDRGDVPCTAGPGVAPDLGHEVGGVLPPAGVHHRPGGHAGEGVGHGVGDVTEQHEQGVVGGGVHRRHATNRLLRTRGAATPSDQPERRR
ncbi:MAG: hypothetical protein ACO3VG_05415, partial [Nitriliruptoraceae bacterium]